MGGDTSNGGWSSNGGADIPLQIMYPNCDFPSRVAYFV